LSGCLVVWLSRVSGIGSTKIKMNAPKNSGRNSYVDRVAK
jgi:hypothetical protein